MRQLKPKDDPTGFLNLFRYAAAMKHGDPSGFIHGHGQYQHRAKKGPGRRHEGPPNGSCQHGAKALRSSPTPRGH